VTMFWYSWKTHPHVGGHLRSALEGTDD
jgi:hypothetical protein